MVGKLNGLRAKTRVRLRRIFTSLAFIITACWVAVGSTTVTMATMPPPPSSFNPVKSCGSLTSTNITDSTDDAVYAIVSATEDPGTATQPASCQVTVKTTHPPAGDQVNIWIWMPTSKWNGRFEGTGGGGYTGGSVSNLPGPLGQGYSVGATDTGHTVPDGSYALNPDHSLNWQLIEDGVLGIHEMTVAGKALVNAYYSKQPVSYFNGCSSAGRQGITEARQYPDDYNGVLATSPAINIAKQRVNGLWGELVMLASNDFLPQCKFDAANAAAIQACDKLDGVADGIITDPRDCKYDPHALVGTSTPCGTITQTDADVISKIWQGPRDTQGNFLWYGIARGASFAGLNNTTTTGGATGAPNSLMTDWVKYWLRQNPNWDWHTLTYQDFEHLFTQASQEFGTVLSDSPDMHDFQQAGGKLMVVHGWSDQLLTPENSIDFYNKVVKTSGGLNKTQDFFRMYLAPGMAHCGGGNGPQPVDPMQSLIKWVEQKKAPDTLLAQKTNSSGTVTQRPLCTFPDVATYKGHGDTNSAANFVCKPDKR